VRQRLEEQLRQAQKMESVGRLAGGVAHDLNNLLSPILGYAELLLDEAAEGSPQQEDLGEIRLAAERARDLVARLLIFGRKHVFELRPRDLRRVVAGAEKMLRGALREDVRLELALPERLSTVRADVAEIERVLMNLAVNAQDAMAQGGAIRIALRDVEEGAAGAPVGRHVLLEVSDDGSGMEAAVRERLFEPFFTTKAVGKGTGLGLSTVYGVVQQHGGHIVCDSAPGAGTTFRIYLPVTDEEPEAARDGVAGARLPRGTETLLVVEDEPLVRRMLRVTLQRQGYRVLTAGSAEDALARANGDGEPIDLLITDVVMPGMNGKELHRALCARHPALKVLYISGHDRSIVAERGVIEEGVHFLRKPLGTEALAHKVRELLG
jgi:two-component system, cell cycle sensor histidine kinase and response regulator CckA